MFRFGTLLFLTQGHVLCSDCYLCFFNISGMKISSFFNINNILEVECSGEKLPSNVDLLSMVLYEVSSRGRQTTRMLASVNFGTSKCLTSSSFGSCSVDKNNSRKTKLKAIVMDMKEKEVRHYGCNVTSFQSGGKTTVFTWSTLARLKRKRNHAFRAE